MGIFTGGYKFQRAAAALALVATPFRALGPAGPSLEPIPVGDMHLTQSSLSESAALSPFEKQGLQTVSLGQLPLDRSYTWGKDRGLGSKIPNTKTVQSGAATGLTFDAADTHSPDWIPQSISTSDDANPSTGLVDGRKWIVVASRSGGELGDNDASRVSFFDVTNPTDSAQARYRNVNLVVPRSVPAGSTEAPFKQLPNHASGIVWSGHYLLMGEGATIHVFDVRKIVQLKDGSYVLPRVGTYQAPGKATRVNGPVSWISGMSLDYLDPAHPKLLTQEWTPDPGGRILTYNLDPKTGLLAVNSDGEAKAASAFRVPYLTHLAGILDAGVDAQGNQRFLTAEMGNPNTLYMVSEGSPAVPLETLAQDSQQFSQIPTGADRRYSAEDQEFWTVNEPSGKREVFQVKVPHTPLPGPAPTPFGVLPGRVEEVESSREEGTEPPGPRQA